LAVQIGDALADAHGWSIVHGDLRPDNIVETNKGRVKVLDFGLAQWTVGGADRADSTSKAAKTRPTTYLSPEQKQSGVHIDERADIFSLGMVLFEMLAGRLPPDAGRPKLSTANPEGNQEIDEILSKALAANRDERYSCAATMVAELLAVLAILNDRASRQRLTQ